KASVAEAHGVKQEIESEPECSKHRNQFHHQRSSAAPIYSLEFPEAPGFPRHCPVLQMPDLTPLPAQLQDRPPTIPLLTGRSPHLISLLGCRGWPLHKEVRNPRWVPHTIHSVPTNLIHD